MSAMWAREERELGRRPGCELLGLTHKEYRTLGALRTPERVQRFIDDIPVNHEVGGETVLSVREVLRQRRAHCIEAAMLAACALWVNGERPLVMHLRAVNDWHHVIALFKRGDCWGAISKTNAVYLRYRDPIYRTLRELVMSYIHEYANARGEKTLRAFSRPFNLATVPVDKWITATEDCWAVHDCLYALPHTRLVSTSQARTLRRFEPFQRLVGRTVQFPEPPPRKRRISVDA